MRVCERMCRLMTRMAAQEWTCLRCGAPSKPYHGQCDGCGAPREVVEHAFPPEIVEVSVPGDIRCISAGLNRCDVLVCAPTRAPPHDLL